MLYELPNGVISVHDSAWECMQMPVQGAVKEFNALKGGSLEPFLFLKVKVHACPKPDPQLRDAIQVLMARKGNSKRSSDAPR